MALFGAATIARASVPTNHHAAVSNPATIRRGCAAILTWAPVRTGPAIQRIVDARVLGIERDAPLSHTLLADRALIAGGALGHAAPLSALPIQTVRSFLAEAFQVAACLRGAASTEPQRHGAEQSTHCDV